MGSKKRSIGVVTMRCNTRNYGGALQAYALHKQFGKLGYSSELINFIIKKPCPAAEKNLDTAARIRRVLHLSPVILLKKVCKRPINRIRNVLVQKPFEKSRAMRHKAFDEFEKAYIPQTDTIYTKETIQEALERYMCFVCGSDQVWNPRWYNEFYRLDFVSASKPKFSYAASMSVDQLTNEQTEVFKNSLSSYIGVSVREKQAVTLLHDVAPVSPVHSLDPTLLLERSDWDAIVSERLVKHPYMFCYFLDCGEKLRKLAKQYAKKHHLRVVCIPYVLNQYHKFDKKYSDRFIESATPADFISLIKHAEVVFTDSFHASVFSSVYEKEFFAFRRYGAPGMSARVETLTHMFGTEARFCDSDEKETLTYIEQCAPMEYSKTQEYENLKEQSLAYLAEMLEKSERMVNDT